MPFLMCSRALSRLPERAARRKLLPASACNRGERRGRRGEGRRRETGEEGRMKGRKKARNREGMHSKQRSGKGNRGTWLRSVQRTQVAHCLDIFPSGLFSMQFQSNWANQDLKKLSILVGGGFRKDGGVGVRLFVWTLFKLAALTLNFCVNETDAERN